MVIIRRRRIKIDFLGIVVGGRQQLRDANLMANTLKNKRIIIIIKLFGDFIQTVLFFRKKV